MITRVQLLPRNSMLAAERHRHQLFGSDACEDKTSLRPTRPTTLMHSSVKVRDTGLLTERQQQKKFNNYSGTG